MTGWTGCRIVTLLTDFGSASSYPGSLRGALLSVDATLTLADITHDVPPYDIMAGSLILRSAVTAFPSGTVHLAVVDPGVGSSRRALVVLHGQQVFVGPDNGLFTPFLDGSETVIAIDEPGAATGRISNTFHGRDLLAPVAARIATGLDPRAAGTEMTDPVRLIWPEPEVRGDRVTGVVVHVDGFGNLITNIEGESLGNRRRVSIRSTCVPLCRTYEDRPPGSLIALVGSGGLLEVAETRGHAGKRLGARPGDVVEVFS